MNKIVGYRGPDSTGFFLDEKISLGHNRLSILDLRDRASQPMHDMRGRFVIVFNGEIYNFRDLKKELKNYVFRTESDTEVILAAYERWGSDCVEKFNGIFAFAIWDKQNQELFLARDHMGVKPLYYYYDGKKFIFSSEIKAIFEHPFARELDTRAINIYFRLLYIPEPLTPWKHIFKLPAAHTAMLKDNQLTLHRYWDIAVSDGAKEKGDAQQEIKKGFINAVKNQLISDRPLGLYLSGGIDSTVLLGVMSELRKKPVDTFTIGFDVAPDQEIKFNADARVAKKTSMFFRSNHHEVVLRPHDVVDNFEKVVWHADDLLSNHTQTAMYVLSAMTKRSADVVLSGDGGDELFAGYDRYYLNYMLDKIQRVPEAIRKNLFIRWLCALSGAEHLYNKINIPKGFDRFAAFMFQKENAVTSILDAGLNDPHSTRRFMREKLSPFFEGNMDSTKLLQLIDLKTWLLDDALNRADRMSMAHAVEERVPFLDKDFVSLAMSVPSSFTVDNRTSGKKIFKEALSEYIPRFVSTEPKRGWFSPIAKWLRGDLKAWTYALLSPGYNSNSKGYLNFKAVQQTLDDHIEGRHYALNTVWSAITFQVWLKMFQNRRL